MNDTQKAIQVFKNGGVVIFPTDTAYGIGCRMDSEEAVRKVFAIKKRSLDNAVLVLVDGIEMAKKYVEIPDNVYKKLIEGNWPGGLSIFLKTIHGRVLNIITANTDILAIRWPDHKKIEKIVTEVGVPIVATSANISGEETPFAISDLNKDILAQVDFVLEGECTYKKESTIVDTTVQPWKIIRSGAVEIKI